MNDLRGVLAGLTALVLSAGGVCAQERLADDAPMSLDYAVGAALRAAPALVAERARLDAAEAGVRTARAPALPQASVGAAYEFGTGSYDPGPNGRALLGSLPSGPEDSLSLGGQNGDGRGSARLSVSQLLYAGGQVRAGVRRARAGERAAAARLLLAEQDVALAVVDAYTALLAADARRRAALVAQERYAAEAAAARTRFEAGTGTRTDVALAEAEAAGAAGALARAEAERSAAQAQLTALGVPVRVPLAPVASPEVPSTVEVAVASALEGDPRIAARQAAATAARQALRQQRARRAPRLRTRANATYAEDQFLTGDEATALTATVELEVPLFEGGAIRAGIDEAQAAVRAETAALDAARRSAEAEARAAFARLRAARAGLAAAQERLSAVRLADQGARLEREVGRRSAQDTLRVAVLAAEAEAGLAEARRAHVLAAFSLRAVMGNLLTVGPVSGQAAR